MQTIIESHRLEKERIEARKERARENFLKAEQETKKVPEGLKGKSFKGKNKPLNEEGSPRCFIENG